MLFGLAAACWLGIRTPAHAQRASTSPTPAASATPDCSARATELELVEFREGALVVLELRHSRRVTSVITGFVVQMPPIPGLRLDQVSVVAPPDEDGSVLLWRSNGERGRDGRVNSQTVGIWQGNYRVSPRSTVRLFLKFDGASDLQAAGVRASDFAETGFFVPCARSGGAGGGGGGADGFTVVMNVLTPTPSASATVTNIPIPVGGATLGFNATLTTPAFDLTLLPVATATTAPPLIDDAPTPTSGADASAAQTATALAEAVGAGDHPTSTPEGGAGGQNVFLTATALAELFVTSAAAPTNTAVLATLPNTGGGASETPPPTPVPSTRESSLDDPTPTQVSATVISQVTSIASAPSATPTPLPTASPQPTATVAQASTDTAAPPTPSATPLVIAAAGVLVRSEISGEVIGDGTLRLYAPTTLNHPDSATVRVELELNNLYITPTPVGAQGTPPPRVTTTAGEQPTPIPPLITDSGLLIYQRMGATLLCDAMAFRGCDAGRSNDQTKLVSGRVTSWSWIIAPEQAASGLQNLRVEVWIVQRNLDGQLEFLDLEGAQYPLQITVNAGGSFDPLPLIVAALVVAVVAGAGWFALRGRTPAPAAPPAQPPNAARPAPFVFISYRRGTSWGQARSIEQNLRQRGANTFIDIDDINEGRFAETIQHAIEQCDYFVPILAPGTLDSLWVRKEIKLALENRKIIVPLLVDGFKLDEGSLPDDVRDIASHNAITLLPEFYEEALDRLAERFLRLGDKGR
jgi:hypothetical protein